MNQNFTNLLSSLFLRGSNLCEKHFFFQRLGRGTSNWPERFPQTYVDAKCVHLSNGGFGCILQTFLALHNTQKRPKTKPSLWGVSSNIAKIWVSFVFWPVLDFINIRQKLAIASKAF